MKFFIKYFSSLINFSKENKTNFFFDQAIEEEGKNFLKIH